MFFHVPPKIILCPPLQEILVLWILASGLGDNVRAVTSSVSDRQTFSVCEKQTYTFLFAHLCHSLWTLKILGGNPRADVGGWEELGTLGDCLVRTFCWQRNTSRGISSPGTLQSATLGLTPGFTTFLGASEKWKSQYLAHSKSSDVPADFGPGYHPLAAMDRGTYSH